MKAPRLSIGRRVAGAAQATNSDRLAAAAHTMQVIRLTDPVYQGTSATATASFVKFETGSPTANAASLTRARSSTPADRTVATSRVGLMPPLWRAVCPRGPVWRFRLRVH